MKRRIQPHAIVHGLFFVLLGISAPAMAAFTSGSSGIDGDLTPTASIVKQIPDNGVFNFGVVNIPTGVTVTFTKNAANTPVTILATGDVTIGGTISVNGSNGSYIVGGVGGPGGFSGGGGGTLKLIGRRGEGPGGGNGGSPRTDNYYCGGGGGGGSYSTSGGTGGNSYASGGAGGSTYGNDRLLPLIGGSGGGGGGGTDSYVAGGGGGGGGAIVIASSGVITVSGSITADGGKGDPGGNASGYGGGGGGGSGGSGGAIRVIANSIAGNGSITAKGGTGGSNCNNGGNGGKGRITLEATSVSMSSDPPFYLGIVSEVVPANIPSLTISSIGGVNSLTTPKGAYNAPDIILPYNTQNPVSIVLTGINIPVNTPVTVKSTPSVGVSNTAAVVTLTHPADESNPNISMATASLNISFAYPSIITASVTFQLAAAGIEPIYAAGERVESIRVATNLGGKSSVTYITASGREIPAVM